MQLNLPRHIVEKSWAKKLERLVLAWTATGPPVARNGMEFGFPSSAGLSATCSRRTWI